MSSNTKLESIDLLHPDEQKSIRAQIKKSGYMKIQDVKNLIFSNQFKIDDITDVDPEFLLIIDAYINYPIFITNNQIFTREDLIEKFPFKEFNTEPEKIFRQQEVGVYVHNKQLEYDIRDISDKPFFSIEDFVKSHAKKGHTPNPQATKKVATKIYIGKDEWEDFCLMKRFVRGFQNLIPIEGGASFEQAVKALPWFIASQGPGGQKLLADKPAEAPEEKPMSAEELIKKKRGRKPKVTSLEQTLGDLGGPIDLGKTPEQNIQQPTEYKKERKPRKPRKPKVKTEIDSILEAL